MRSFVNSLAFSAVIPMLCATFPAFASSSFEEDVPLISRETFFGNPDKASLRLSPDGQRLSYLAPLDGVLNIWVAPADHPDQAKPVTKDDGRGIRNYFWAYTNDQIVYLKDKDGDENWRVYAVEVETGETTDLTPVDGVAARIQEVSHKTPNEILIAINDRDPRLHDVYRVNLETGERELVAQNDQGFVGFLTDDDYRVRMAMRMTPDGGSEILRYDDGEWSSFAKIGPADALTTSAIGFDKSGETLYMTDSRDRDTAALKAVSLETGDSRVIAEDNRADVGDAMIHPTEKTIEAVGFNYKRKNWKVLDESIERDLEYLRTVADGDLEVVSRTLNDDEWIVAYLMDNGPVRYYHYERESQNAKFLFTNRSDLEGLPLAKMRPVVIDARDGKKLVSYLTIPTADESAGEAGGTWPMVLLVHGGPWARDEWGYNPIHQWLANRGYAVLSVNFRGSTGFGKEFLNAGNREWAAAMHDDLIDATQWAIDGGVADPDRVAIMGGSYGGYATLVGLTFTPDLFACGVDIVGPSNLVTLLNSIPPYWAPMIEMFTTRVGDHRTEEGRAFLLERSPLSFVERIEKPLLIGQGANDPRVKQAEADQIVAAMEEKSIPVTYVLFPDEGHGFARPENNLAFFAVTEAFLAEHLGGRREPIGDDFEGSSLQVPVGADGVPGVAEALAPATDG
ncbi:MAG: S9 family peptidase [Phycisphaerales bacterium]